MRLLLILLLTLQINSLKADEIFNLLKIPNLDVYKLNNSNGLKYLNAKKNFKIGFENNIRCNKANKNNLDKKFNLIFKNLSIYRKDFLEQFLEFYNSQEKPTRFSLATPNCYEWFSYNKVAEYSRIGGVKNRLFAVPKESIVKHYEPNDIKERKV